MSTSRKISKERTRAKLLQGTLRVLHTEGAGALTTGRIAESAGVAQPTFYVHFSGIDEALQLAATAVSDRWLVSVHAARQGVDRSSGVRPSIHGIIASYVDTLLEDPKGAELFLRHRRDATSSLGRTFSKLSEKMKHDLIEDLSEAGHLEDSQLGPRPTSVSGSSLAQSNPSSMRTRRAKRRSRTHRRCSICSSSRR